MNELRKLPEEKILNPRQKRFVELYASDREFFGSGIDSYAEAYDIDVSTPQQYRRALSGASQLLKKPYILQHINDKLETNTLNDNFVDKQLGFVITQHFDLGAKMAAIREYNKLKSRIIEKSLQLNVQLPAPILGGQGQLIKSEAVDESIRTDNGDQEGTTA